MNRGRQRTLKRKAGLEGVGMHTGETCRLEMRPAPAGSGYVFVREDLAARPRIPARLENVTATVRGTNVGLDNVQIHTVEHVLSALRGLGVDNAEIGVWGPEPPITDGSSLPFAEAIRKAGTVEQDAARDPLELDAPVDFEINNALYRAEPSERFELEVVYEHDSTLIGTQTYKAAVDPATYLADIAPARTFGFEYEIEQLRAHGLAKGGSLENAIVIKNDETVANPDGLRFEDEFVRHKALDLLGDLALLGRPLGNVRVRALRGGHQGNTAFAKKLIA